MTTHEDLADTARSVYRFYGNHPDHTARQIATHDAVNRSGPRHLLHPGRMADLGDRLAEIATEPEQATAAERVRSLSDRLQRAHGKHFEQERPR